MATNPPARPSLAPVPFLRDRRVRLVLTSASILFVELLLIRWIPSTVKYVGFFTNFVLMASFLGIGLGIMLGRSGRRLPFAPFGPALLLVVALVLMAHLDVQVRSGDEIFFGLAESSSADANFLVLPLVFLLVTGVMAALALPLGPLLRGLPPLQAYAFDIAGSLMGIAGFTILSALWTPPLVWFAVVAALAAALGLAQGVGRRSLVTVGAMTAILVLVLGQSTATGTIWSPYYRIGLEQVGTTKVVEVDGIPHQRISQNGVTNDGYYLVYRWFPKHAWNNVLIVGAGTGNDVSIALANGARHVDAVEIDPAIQQIGVNEHPARPYQDPRVSVHINDGRAFLRTTDQRYDLVIFALPDSLTLVASTGNIRLESFLFTVEAFESVRDHLAPDGVFTMYNFYRQPWLISKLGDMLNTAFGTQPILRTYSSTMAVFADGPAVAALHGKAPGGAGFRQPDPDPATQATDDWPFLYLRTPSIQPHYLVALALILLFALLAVAGSARVTQTPMRSFSPHFFVLGTAFLLLETRSLVSFSLLFGTTWLVNSLAFFAILASVLLAIFVNARLRIRRSRPLYGLLFVALAVAFALPPEQLLIDPLWLRYLLAAAVAFVPVFVANLIFTYSFRDTRIADMAFASNLIGAMLGGVLEYLSLITGYRFLLLVVAGLYALAWLFATRVRLLADAHLTTEIEATAEVAAADQLPGGALPA